MIYYTKDVTASVRKLYAKYTHVIINRFYNTINPITYDSGKIIDLPLYVYVPWDDTTFDSRNKWKANGGVLVDTGNTTKITGKRDALILVETPFSEIHLAAQTDGTEQDIVIYRPPSWKTHDWAATIKFPTSKQILEIRESLIEHPERESISKITRHEGSLFVLTDAEMVAGSKITAQELLFFRKSLKSKEVWVVKLRIKPDFSWVGAWNTMEALPSVDGVRMFTALPISGWRKQIKQMARGGNITLTRYHVYPNKAEWLDVMDRKHAKAVADWGAMKQYAEALPDHLA